VFQGPIGRKEGRNYRGPQDEDPPPTYAYCATTRLEKSIDGPKVTSSDIAGEVNRQVLILDIFIIYTFDASQSRWLS
jgi:hypothetical protein